MCAAHIQIENITFWDKHRFDFCFLRLPLHFIQIQILHLLLLIFDKLCFISIQLSPLILQGIPLMSNQVLKVDHKLLNQHIGRRSLPLTKVLLNGVFTYLPHLLLLLLLLLHND